MAARTPMAHSRPRAAIPSTALASTGAARASLCTAGTPPGAVQRSSSAANARSDVAPAGPDAATASTAADARCTSRKPMSLPPSLELDLFHRAAAAGTGANNTGAVRFPFTSYPVTHPYYFFGQAAAAAAAGCHMLKVAPTVTVAAVAQSDSDSSSVVDLSPPAAVSTQKKAAAAFDLDLNCPPPAEAEA